MHHPTDRIIHTTAFVTPVVEHWLEREIALEQGVAHDCIWIIEIGLTSSIHLELDVYKTSLNIVVAFAYICFRFKHTVLGTHISYLVNLSWTGSL